MRAKFWLIVASVGSWFIRRGAQRLPPGLTSAWSVAEQRRDRRAMLFTARCVWRAEGRDPSILPAE